MIGKLFQRVSRRRRPIRTPSRTAKEFDVADLYRGPVAVPDEAGAASLPLDEKLRQAYFWIVNHAIISPFYDIEYNEGPPQTFALGDTQSKVTFPSGQSYCSFVLLPLLTFAVRAKCLLVGGPGRGKTASAILMGVLAGYSLRDVRRAIQNGQPQMTIADLLGNPLPADLVQAKSLDQIGIAWRKWLGMRVKIIDEYNRIPTRTQSALLTLMADNYAELFDQTYECPEAAWYLTANDDAGGGTYQVIEALRDRIDIVVKALHFNTRFLGDLLDRLEAGIRPEEVVPGQIIFSEEEGNRLHARDSHACKCPRPILRRLEFFASQFEYLRAGGRADRIQDQGHGEAGRRRVVAGHGPRHGQGQAEGPRRQTRNGLSVRSLMTSLMFVKAMAYFRGAAEVEPGRRAADHSVRAARQAGPGRRLPVLRGGRERRAAHRQDRLDSPHVRPGLRRVRPARTGQGRSRSAS